MAGDFVNTSYPPYRVDVEGYGPLAPGEVAYGVEPGSEHNKALEEEGAITRVHTPTKESKAAKEDKS